MNTRYSRFALTLALTGALSASLLACNKPAEIIIPVVADGTLTTNVKSALAAEPELKGIDISVAAHDGVVEIGGIFDSYPKIDRALTIARAVTGVKSIDDKTAKKDAPAAPAAAAPAAVEAAPAAK
ncbi:MAG TPA: BON domain-containing protein [Rhodocyclaceae bacterium]|nr:BON domain-containing protein [Rhodocyclaceae bacterium]